jgi:Uma2 family endonuclease
MVYDRSSLTGDYMVMIPDQTPADFERLAPESRYCDYIDGVICLPSTATDRHQELVGFLFDLLNGHRLARKEIGQVLMGPAVVRVSPQRKLEPDIFVRAAAEWADPKSKALLVIETLSPSTRSLDRGLKLEVYRAANIPEIWLIDDRDQRATIEQRGPKRYRRNELTHGRLDSSTITGFWIEVAWLWENPLPNPRTCLDLILSATKA